MSETKELDTIKFLERLKLEVEDYRSLLALALRLRQAESIGEAVEASKKILRKTKGHDSNIILLDNNEINEFAENNGGLEHLLLNRFTDKRIAHIRGKRSIQHKIGYPDNLKRVLGFMELEKEITEKEYGFIALYTAIVGQAIHTGMETEHHILRNTYSGLFLRSLNHELRNDLHIPNITLEILKEDEDKPPKDKNKLSKKERIKNMNIIKNRIAVMNDKLDITSLLDMTPEKLLEMYKGKTRPIRLCEEFEKEVKDYSERVKRRNIILALDKDLESLDVMMPKCYCMSTVGNLLGNATKYSPFNSPIYIYLKNSGDDIKIGCISTSEKIFSEKELYEHRRKYKTLRVAEDSLHGTDEGLGTFILTSIARTYDGIFMNGSGEEFSLEKALSNAHYNVILYNGTKIPNATAPYYSAELTFPKKRLLLPAIIM